MLDSSDRNKTQFLLDPCSNNLTSEIKVCENDKLDTNTMFSICRTWCYAIHRAKDKIAKISM